MNKDKIKYIDVKEQDGKDGLSELISLTKPINQEEFKKDFNNNVLTNSEMLLKYKFKSVKDCCDYARKNNLIIFKENTEAEKENLKGISNFLKGVFR